MHLEIAAKPAGVAVLSSRRPALAVGRACRGRLAVHNLFTGIVQGQATVRAIDRKQDFRSFDIELPAERAHNVTIGGSVAINGTCLTVVRADGPLLRFDVIQETLRRTNLGLLEEGSLVNFERSARVGDEIGGHNVSGHVHSVARILSVQNTENNRRLEFELADPTWMKYVLPKGFISVDGCSLTVGEVTPTTFSVYLIPETLRVTVLGGKGEGDYVNIEVENQTQAVVDTVERVMERYLAERGLLPGGQSAAAAPVAPGSPGGAAVVVQPHAMLKGVDVDGILGSLM